MKRTSILAPFIVFQSVFCWFSLASAIAQPDLPVGHGFRLYRARQRLVRKRDHKPSERRLVFRAGVEL